MLIVESIAKIRRVQFNQGLGIKTISRELNLSKKLVRKVKHSGDLPFRGPPLTVSAAEGSEKQSTRVQPRRRARRCLEPPTSDGSSPCRRSYRWCVGQRGTVNSSETLCPSALDCAHEI